METYLTPERIAKIKDYCAKATAGPWHEHPYRRCDVAGGGEYVGALTVEVHGNKFKEDRQFIANARTDLPAAISEIGRLIKENSRLEELVQEFQASGLIDVGNVGGPCCVEPRHIEQYVTELRSEIDSLTQKLELERNSNRQALHEATSKLQ